MTIYRRMGVNEGDAFGLIGKVSLVLSLPFAIAVLCILAYVYSAIQTVGLGAYMPNEIQLLWVAVAAVVVTALALAAWPDRLVPIHILILFEMVFAISFTYFACLMGKTVVTTHCSEVAASSSLRDELAQSSFRLDSSSNKIAFGDIMRLDRATCSQLLYNYVFVVVAAVLFEMAALSTAFVASMREARFHRDLYRDEESRPEMGSYTQQLD